jgi:hypothetical protein
MDSDRTQSANFLKTIVSSAKSGSGIKWTIAIENKRLSLAPLSAYEMEELDPAGSRPEAIDERKKIHGASALNRLIQEFI